MKPVSVFDVAKFILDKKGKMTAMKLQKLVYYSQAWSLVWDETPLFNEKIEAWANGPVVRELYNKHRGMFLVDSGLLKNIDKKKLNDDQIDTIKAVLDFYGEKNAQWLSDLTHAEQPWKEARLGLPENERGCVEITPASMHEYYSSLQ